MLTTAEHPQSERALDRRAQDAGRSVDAALHALTLAFRSPALEQAFRVEHRAATLGPQRRSFLLAALLYAAFWPLDVIMIPDVAPIALLIRLGFVCPLALGSLALSFHHGFVRRLPLLAGLVGFIAGLGIIAMITLAAPPFVYTYHAGLLLIIMALYSFLHLRWPVASVLSWGLVGIYELVGVLVGTEPIILVSNSYLLIGANVIGLLACHATERAMRTAFVGRRRIEDLARRDSLTGLLNRRAFFGLAEIEVAAHQGQHEPVSVIMLDLDHFKQVNDGHGHAVGDQVLEQVAGVLRQCLRPEDIACRYGGEEFLVLLPGVAVPAAQGVGERLRVAVERLTISTARGTVRPTASVGVATLIPGGAGGLDGLMLAADGAMYTAKRAGRNVVALAA